MAVTLKINGRDVALDIPDDTPLLWAVRDELDLKGTKFGCGIGMCGACTVHVNGVAQRSCITPVASLANASITIIEGLNAEGANGEKYDPFSINGADHWYDVGPHQVRAIMNDLAQQTFRPGWLRSVAPGWTNWASECFMDEAALMSGVDPLVFRQGLLTGQGKNAGSAPKAVGGAKRMSNVLARAAAKVGWGKTLLEGQGMGIACTFGQERAVPTWTACVAQVTVDADSGAVSLNKRTMVIDAGTIVHPDGALAQTEGAALWGASLALHEGTEFVDGQIKDTNLNGYRPMRMGDVPELDIEFVESDEQPVGLGEPATTVVGPAIGNAIFAAAGARVRHLPIRPDAVKQAISEAKLA